MSNNLGNEAWFGIKKIESFDLVLIQCTKPIICSLNKIEMSTDAISVFMQGVMHLEAATVLIDLHNQELTDILTDPSDIQAALTLLGLAQAPSPVTVFTKEM